MSVNRPLCLLIAAICGVLFVALLDFGLSETAAIVVLDKGGTMPPYPFSVQNTMWLVFFLGLGELYVRYAHGTLELDQLTLGFLPENHDAMLVDRDMPTIYQNVKSRPRSLDFVLPRMIQRTVLQFQSTRSIDQSSSVLGSSLDLFMHEVDLRYAPMRYIIWLIPSLGFIGTVVGIAIALNYAGQPGVQGSDTLLTEVTRRLAVAFNTTLIALLQAAVLVYMQGAFQAREERAVNLAGQYCIDNLINRLYVREH
jgi:biopolymer transport protein ExbB/TolQ